MITCRQLKMARAGLDWSVRDLADKAGISANTISRIENGADSRASTLKTLQQIYEEAGIEFLSESGGVGVRYKEPRK